MARKWNGMFQRRLATLLSRFMQQHTSDESKTISVYVTWNNSTMISVGQGRESTLLICGFIINTLREEQCYHGKYVRREQAFAWCEIRKCLHQLNDMCCSNATLWSPQKQLSSLETVVTWGMTTHRTSYKQLAVQGEGAFLFEALAVLILLRQPHTLHFLPLTSLCRPCSIPVWCHAAPSNRLRHRQLFEVILQLPEINYMWSQLNDSWMFRGFRESHTDIQKFPQ